MDIYSLIRIHIPSPVIARHAERLYIYPGTGTGSLRESALLHFTSDVVSPSCQICHRNGEEFFSFFFVFRFLVCMSEFLVTRTRKTNDVHVTKFYSVTKANRGRLKSDNCLWETVQQCENVFHAFIFIYNV